MAGSELELPADAAEAVAMLREASRTQAVVVFKKSPICPVSTDAERRFETWREGARDVATAIVDVVARRPLARGLTAELGIRHESPQVLVFRDGELSWHDSHWNITEDTLEAAVRG